MVREMSTWRILFYICTN